VIHMGMCQSNESEPMSVKFLEFVNCRIIGGIVGIGGVGINNANLSTGG